MAAVGVAGAATKLKRSAAGDACLCTPETQAPNDLTAVLEPNAPPAFASRGVTTPGGSTSAAGALSAALPGNLAARPEWAGTGAGANGNGNGWGAGGRYFGARSASSSGRSATLGGLWRLMTLSNRAPSHASSSTARAKAPKAAQKPKERPRSSKGGGGGASSGPSTTLAANQTSDLFAEQNASIPDLLGNGNAAVISTPGGRSGGGDPGSLAATPEPGPLFLLGAGLIAVASLLRRRLAEQ